MTALQFNVRDLLKSVRVAFGLQRLWIQFTGMIPGYLLYFVLAYAALLVKGNGLSASWNEYGLLPWLPAGGNPFLAVLLFTLGLFCLIYCYLYTATAVARAAYMHLKGNAFYTWKEAMAFAARKKFSILLTPLIIAVLVGCFVFGGLVVGWAGLIPVVGEIGVSLLTILWFAVSLFLVALILALAISLCYTPAVLACTDDDAFEGIFQSFSTLFSQPWRYLFYKVVILILAVLTGASFILISKTAWNVMIKIIGFSMGDKFVDIASVASFYVQSWTRPFVALYESLIGGLGSVLFYSHDFTSVAVSGVSAVSAILVAISAVVLGGYVLSYPLAVINVGNTLSFLVIKKLKDDENLLERMDQEEDEDEEDASGEAAQDKTETDA